MSQPILLDTVFLAPRVQWIVAALGLKLHCVINLFANQVSLDVAELVHKGRVLLDVIHRLEPTVAIADHNALARDFREVWRAGMPGTIFEDDAVAGIQ